MEMLTLFGPSLQLHSIKILTHHTYNAAPSPSVTHYNLLRTDMKAIIWSTSKRKIIMNVHYLHYISGSVIERRKTVSKEFSFR